MLDQLINITSEYVHQWGYFLAFLVLFLENSIFLGAFVPGETIAFLAGVFAAKGVLLPLPLMLLITSGAILGDSIGFWLGRHKGRKWLKKIGGFFGYREEKIERAYNFWEEKGTTAIFSGRFIAVARTFVPFFAGASKIEYRKFIIFDASGAIIWSAIHIIIGYFFGENYQRVQAVFGGIGIVLFIVLVISVYKYLVKKTTD